MTIPLNPTPQSQNRPRCVLAFSGSDPSGGAGLEVDLKVMQALGIYGMAVPTLSTVQNTLGVQAVRPADPEWMKRQALAIIDDLPIDAIKIGALPNAPVIQALIDLLNHPKLRSIPWITDTVLGASQGMKFLDEQGIQLLVAEIFPRSRLVTPNWPEWQTLLPHISGIKSSQTAFWADIENEPQKIEAQLRSALSHQPYALLLKGGHLPGDAIDRLCEKGEIQCFSTPRIITKRGHGTGCALATAIACHVALGDSLPDAVLKAKAFVERAMINAPQLGNGKGPLAI